MSKFHCLVALLREILDKVCIVIVCVIIATGRDVKNFEINLNFLIKPFFLFDQKVKTKI